MKRGVLLHPFFMEDNKMTRKRTTKKEEVVSSVKEAEKTPEIVSDRHLSALEKDIAEMKGKLDILEKFVLNGGK